MTAHVLGPDHLLEARGPAAPILVGSTVPTWRCGICGQTRV